MKTKEHKHEWICADEENNDKIVCENCRINYDEWVEKMTKKGYTMKQLERFEVE